jgi:hypothetical protein
MLSWAALEVVSDLGYAQGSVGLRGGMVEKMRSAFAEGGTRPLQLNKHGNRDPDGKSSTQT